MTTVEISEAAWQEQVLELAQLYRWLAYHTFDSRRSAAGFPDLVLARAPELLIVELKSERGRVRPEQRDWLEVLAACGIETHVWRPSDFDVAQKRLYRDFRRLRPPVGNG